VKKKCKCVFLDRDGVINKKAPEGDYIKNWSEFKFLPGVKEAIKRLNKAGFLVIIVTNQRGIAKGLMTKEDLEDIHSKMIKELKKSGVRINSIYYCPHDEKDNCNCRKPKSGMFLRAKEDFEIDFTKSWVIGDSIADIEAGKIIKCETILINKFNKKGNILKEREIKPDFIVNNLKNAINIVYLETFKNPGL